MATRLFFRDTTANTGGYVATEKSTVLPAGTGNLGGAVARDLSSTAGTSAVLGNLNTLAQTAHQDGYLRKFFSEPLVADITAQTWTLGVSIGESNNAANAFIVCSVYVLTSGDTVRGYVYDSDTPLGAEWSLGSNAGRVVTFSGAAVSGVVSTDRLVVEFWAHGVQSMSVSYVLDFGYNGTTAIVDGAANADPASFIETPQNGLFAVPPSEGAATGAVGWAGSAAGVAVHAGAASGTVAWVGSADGVAPGAEAGYLNLTGASGSYATSPDDASFDILADIDIRADLAADDWTGPGTQKIVGRQDNASGYEFKISSGSTGILGFTWYDDGLESVNNKTSSAAPTIADGERLQIRVTVDADNGAGGHVVRFYTRTDTTLSLSDHTGWTQLGTDQTGAFVIQIKPGANAMVIGADFDLAGFEWAGKMYQVWISDGIAGTIVASPDFRDADQITTPNTVFTDDQGRVWTINSPASWVPPTATTPEGTATGTIAWVGTSTGTADYEGSGTGAVGWAGTAAGTSVHSGAASGAIAWAGTADGVTPTGGAATGSIGWAGTADGTTTRAGAATGAVSWVGAADGTTTRQGSTTGAIAWVGAADGATIHAGASTGTVTWAGSATGEAPTVGQQEGSATGAISWAGTASGATTHEGSAAGSVSWAGTSTGTTVYEGSGTGAITWAGSADGVAPTVGAAEGSATGTIGWAGTADGQASFEGSSVGAIAWAGSATGTTGFTGSASGTIAWVGVATGSQPVETFWTPDPVAYTSDPAAHTADSAAYVPVGPGDTPPNW